jgi:Flp pilus assembly protein TadG
MKHKRLQFPQFLSDQRGGTLVLFAVMLPVLVILMAMAVDAGRAYAVQAKAQNASDAALLGAVASIGANPDLQGETVRLFNANYPTNYMSSTVGAIATSIVSPGVYQATFTVTVPTTVTGIFSSDIATIQILSEVTSGYDVTQNRRLELALVLDNTGSMAGAKLAGLKQASRDLTDIIFGTAETLNNVHISLLPYDVGVNLGTDPSHSAWIQGAYLPIWNTNIAGGHGWISNRNSDLPPNSYNDMTDTPPGATDETRFRISTGVGTGTCNDATHINLPAMQFALNTRSQIYSFIDTMIAGLCTRINVGLMWGGLSLSPQWAGIWDPARPNLPATPSALIDKALVLMTDGLNTVYMGDGVSMANDDATTAQMCSAIKSRGITIYVVGFGSGGEINENLLRACASQPSYYWNAPTPEQLRTAFRQIADDIVFNTLRLSR